MNQTPLASAMRKMTARVILVTLGLTAVLSLSSCSSFHREWKQALQTQPAVPVTPSGAWVGTWKSTGTGHTGELRAVLGKMPAARSGVVPFHYHARWGRVLRAPFLTQQPTMRLAQPGHYLSEGAWELPAWAGGAYRYRFHATPSRLDGTYRSAADHGTLTLRRPLAAKAQTAQ